MRARAVASGLVALHLVAVMIGPLSLPPSLIGSTLRDWFRPYLEAAYLDHAYKFFAPDPGPSHLIRYELEFADGSRLTGRFPDLNEEWPRLLYHRHFMLSEFVGAFPPNPEFDPRGDWNLLPLSIRQVAYVRSYAEHLIHRHQALRVSLYLVEHAIPAPLDVLEGMPLDHPDLYRQRKLGAFTSADFGQRTAASISHGAPR